MRKWPWFGIVAWVIFVVAALTSLYVRQMGPGNGEKSWGYALLSGVILCYANIGTLFFATLAFLFQERPRWPALTAFILGAGPAAFGVYGIFTGML